MDGIFSVAGALTDWFGVVGDVGGHYGGEEQQRFVEIDLNAHTFLAGPQVWLRGDRITGFVRALVGVSRLSASANLGDLSVSEDETAFAFGGGGGVDLAITDRIAIRAIQADYVNVRFSGEGSSNVRLSAGLRYGF